MIVKGNVFDFESGEKNLNENILRHKSETMDNNNERRVLDTSRLLGQELIL